MDVPAVVALSLIFGLVLPIWIVAHYITRWRTSKVMTNEDERILVDLWNSVERIEDRLDTLERILDTTEPEWNKEEM